MRRVLAIFAALLATSGWAQDYQERVELSAILERALRTSQDIIEVNNKHVVITDVSPSDINGVTARLSSRYPSSKNAKGWLQIPVDLKFTNCTFAHNVSFNRMEFQDLQIVGSNFGNLRIGNSQFQQISLEENTLSGALEIVATNMQSFNMLRNNSSFEIYMEADTILGDINIENNTVEKGELLLTYLQCQGSVTIGNNSVTGIIIENSQFLLPLFGEFNKYQLPGSESLDIYLIENEFLGDSTARVSFNKGNYLNLDIRKNKFGTNVYFTENRVNDRFFLVENEFLSHVSFEKFLFSEIWNELYWTQIEGFKLRYIDYGAITEDDLESLVEFKNLINIYKDLHSIFLSRGDLASANACYSEMKELQGKMLKHQYRQKPTFGNFFRWQLNVLLKIYTNHGTDPALAVVMSLYVIFIFAALYLFFPSEWDVNSRKRMLKNYQKLREYKGKSYVTPTTMFIGAISLTLLNAVTLSINSFVTLGFGRIPTRGLARYFCIVEGFIGWFLLSIFTVALINQVLA